MKLRWSKEMLSDVKSMIDDGLSVDDLRKKYRITRTVADQVARVSNNFDKKTCYETSSIEWRAVLGLYASGITTEDRLAEWFKSFMSGLAPRVPSVGPKALSQIESMLRDSGRI